MRMSALLIGFVLLAAPATGSHAAIADGAKARPAAAAKLPTGLGGRPDDRIGGHRAGRSGYPSPETSPASGHTHRQRRAEPRPMPQ